jgi:hypothetical protein
MPSKQSTTRRPLPFFHFQVFNQEKVNGKSGPFHKYCLSCNECRCNLDASTFTNGMDGEVYCKHCYASK